MTPASRRSVVPAPAREHTPDTSYGAGDVIGGCYELENRIGQGATGEVWVARSLTLGSRVALKLLRGPGENRFIEEARIAAQLEHPGIVRVFDYGETSRGDPFLVMERLHGESFEDILARGPLDSIRAVQILLPVIDAFHAAHAQGLIHRDIKPANLFLAGPDPARTSAADVSATQWLRPKVIDFGLAKRWRAEDTKLTPSNVLVGSPAYMAPEQAMGLDVDGRADVWALCVVLYELVTGRLPFTGESELAFLKAIVEEPPAPLYQVIDPALVAILMRGMAKSPRARWQSMFELGVALANWLVTQQVEEDVTGASVRATWIDRRRIDVLVRASTPRSPRAFVTERPTSTMRRPRLRLRRIALLSTALVFVGAMIGTFASRASHGSGRWAGTKSAAAAPPAATPKQAMSGGVLAAAYTAGAAEQRSEPTIAVEDLPVVVDRAPRRPALRRASAPTASVTPPSPPASSFAWGSAPSPPPPPPSVVTPDFGY